MKEYTLKVITNQNDKINKLPPTPFVVEILVVREDGDKYLVANKNNNCYKLIALNTETTGNIVDHDYTEDEILKVINEDKWILRKSEINII